MKLVEMKCKNCGAMLKVDDEAKSVTCQYCNTVFSIDDEAQHVQYDNMFESGYEFERGRISAQKNEENKEEIKEETFNDKFEKYNGTQHKMLIDNLLDNVVINNKKNDDQQISVVYRKLNTIEPDKIIELKHKLKYKSYEVVLNYDEADNVNNVTIRDIKMTLTTKFLLALVWIPLVILGSMICYFIYLVAKQFFSSL